MKTRILFILFLCSLQWVTAQNIAGVEITNEDVKITTGNNGKAYYNDKEIATKDDLHSIPPGGSIQARAIFTPVNLFAGTQYTYLKAQSVQGTQNIIRLNDADNLIVIPEDGYYSVDFGPIRMDVNHPVTVTGKLIAKAPNTTSWILMHSQSMEEAGTTYPGFNRLLYLKAGTILEFGLISSDFTTLVSVGELTDNNGLVIVKIAN
jgi:hypothetical protein